MAIMVFGTILVGRSAQRDTVDAVRSVSMLYLDELAGRREQVVEDNLLEALKRAEYAAGYSYEQVVRDFHEGNKGVVAFSYNGIQETLSYIPVSGTNWLLTYLIRESVISERISAVSEGIIRRSLVQSVLTALILGALFAYLVAQMRRNARLTLEKETAEA